MILATVPTGASSSSDAPRPTSDLQKVKVSQPRELRSPDTLLLIGVCHVCANGFIRSPLSVVFLFF